MPAAIEDKADRTEQMWSALKRHILRERERKKQEREAEVEEERLRKEREAREQQDVMTLGETKEQIGQLESKLALLKEEKHQLFLQLKKVLNEDDNRRRQLQKESSEMVSTIQTLPPALVAYMPPTIPRSTSVSQQGFKATTKRPRSPSPPQSVPVSLYHQSYGYKPAPVANTSYQSPQKDDSRRHEFVRAVLWNKTPQYANPPAGTFYPVPPQELSIYYAPTIQQQQQQPQQQQQQAPPPTREQSRQVFDAQRQQQQQQQQQQSSYHMTSSSEKPLEHYTLRPPSSQHIIHSGMNPAGQQSTKSGSITQGYPVRQAQYQQVPAPPASALYTAQSRPLYQSPSAPMNYPPTRE